MSKCLYCYQELDEGQVDFHPSCARKFFGNDTPPILPYTRDNMTELAKQVIRTSTSVTGVQAKMSLDVNRGSKNEPARFTIVGLWGKYIFKPQSAKYPNLPELEDLTMKMAEIAHIRTARHTLIRLADGELGYLTLRMDRGRKGEKISMLDMCQLTNRLTEHKYYGTYQQLAETIKKYSSAPMLDVQRFWEIVLFSWMTGNSDMHCKNFSLIDSGNGEYVLSLAYDLLAVLLADPQDPEEMAMSFSLGGKKNGFNRNTFMSAFTQSGIPATVADRMINRMAGYLPDWKKLISHSFLSEKMQIAYCSLLDKRREALENL
ncbi:HipA domain-containing protein [Segatella bryantii]|uniref:Toxin HipA n=1 Tax=Segatella bryantii TaxID=77095 RepID=A0ABX4EGY7_SEGBR|nr:HipA domain-containing protein [Segatella bryantii]OYP54909.1 toxin HipA [Segatella bryantii]UKK82057.1 HipA domain-containing protein [Segatella bryantii]